MMALAVLLLGGGYLAYFYRQVQTTGQAVFHEIEGDGLAIPEGVMDDPVFAELPPPERPVSLGRYKLPQDVAQVKLPAPTPPAPSPPAAPPSKPAKPSGKPAPEPQRPAPVEPSTVPPAPVPAPQQPAAPAPPAPRYWPASFSERLKTQARLHLLVVGTDQQKLGSGRGDVLMVLTLDPVARRLMLTSIPRDTRVTLPGQGTVKINAAYAHGGIEQQTLAVERFLGLPMDKYVEVSLSGFRRAIDRVGGVTVEPTMSFSVGDDVFRPGTMHLSGAQAESYTRMRKEDPRGDLGRNDRQQQVIRALVQALGQKSIPELQKLTIQLRQDLRTNLTPTEAVQLRAAHGYAFEHLTQVPVQGVGRMVGGAWYYLVSDAERRRLHLALR